MLHSSFMGDNQDEIINFYKKRIEPFIAIFILALLITFAFLLWEDNQLKKEIGENCGYEDKWGGMCYCDRQTILDKQLEYEQMQNGGNDFYVPLDR